MVRELGIAVRAPVGHSVRPHLQVVAERLEQLEGLEAQPGHLVLEGLSVLVLPDRLMQAGPEFLGQQEVAPDLADRAELAVD